VGLEKLFIIVFCNIIDFLGFKEIFTPKVFICVGYIHNQRFKKRQLINSWPSKNSNIYFKENYDSKYVLSG